jgi:hypothetical protein
MTHVLVGLSMYMNMLAMSFVMVMHLHLDGAVALVVLRV